MGSVFHVVYVTGDLKLLILLLDRGRHTDETEDTLVFSYDGVLSIVDRWNLRPQEMDPSDFRGSSWSSSPRRYLIVLGVIPVGAGTMV